MGYSDPPPKGRSTPSLFSRGGTLLPSIYADARYVDAVIVSKASSSAFGMIGYLYLYGLKFGGNPQGTSDTANGKVRLLLRLRLLLLVLAVCACVRACVRACVGAGVCSRGDVGGVLASATWWGCWW